MGRLRIIDRDAVLTAAETVVRRDGAARLTIEAVAAEAGISKASVLYDYKTKQALIKAIVERRVAAECERVRKIIEELGAAPDSAIQGCIAAAAMGASNELRCGCCSPPAASTLRHASPDTATGQL